MIRVGVVGAGHWGPNLIRNFHNHQTSEVLWVVDRSPEQLERVAQRCPDVRMSTEVSELLGDSRVEAVVVATPTVTHHALVKAALEAGKHVLVEKPITNHVAQAEELCELAERRSLVLMVGHVFLYNAAVQRVRQYLDERRLGRIYYVSMVRTNLGPIRADVNAAWDLAAHDISVANYWLDAEPVTASAVGGSWINPGVEDAVFVTLRYPDNVLVNLHASWLNPRKARDTTVVGDRRMLTFDDMNLSEPIRIYDKYVSDEPAAPRFIDTFASFRANVRVGDVTIPYTSLGEPLKAECDQFVACVSKGEHPISDGRTGLAVVRALEAITRSVANGGREEPVRAA
jgi:predicted dehydrogenase